jgi:cytidine deaminase
MDWQPLVDAALAAQARAYAPYSHFPVGAALLADDGTIVAGCNVENASLGLTLCAERVALAAAVTQGLHHFRALVVASDGDPAAAPCGLCRQTLIEFADDLPILLVNRQGERTEVRLAELVPRPFHLRR